jgi:uncharacterized protein (TIGR03067 family)
MRRLSLLIAVLFVVPLFGSDSPKEYDDKAVNYGIDGTWRLIEVEKNGEKIRPPILEVITFRGGTYTYTFPEEGIVSNPKQWSYRIDCTHQPPHLDYISSIETVKCIYQIDRDTLKIANKDELRPQSFKDTNTRVATYKRVK